MTREIIESVNRGARLSLEEFDKLRGAQELIDDALEIEFGRQKGIDPGIFGSVATGPGFAIVVGHTKNSPGAGSVPPISQSEYAWNTDLATRIKSACTRKNIQCKIFFRDGIGISGAYRQVHLWGASCVVELHFNAFNSTANGTETLYDADTNAGSLAWSKRLQSSMLSALRLSDRGLKERDPGDRGYASVSALNIPSALIEPFFGDNPSDARVAQANKDELAESIADAAMSQMAVA